MAWSRSSIIDSGSDARHSYYLLLLLHIGSSCLTVLARVVDLEYSDKLSSCYIRRYKVYVWEPGGSLGFFSVLCFPVTVLTGKLQLPKKGRITKHLGPIEVKGKENIE